MKHILSAWFQKVSQRSVAYFKRDSSCNHPDHYVALGWKILVGGLGLFLLWACFAPLDAGVSVPAYVISDGERKAVQHAAGGIIEHVFVSEGQQVEKGQTLVKMNSVNSIAKENSNLAAVRALDENIKQKQRQLILLNQQVSNMNSLAADGYIPKNRALELERSKHQLQDSLASDIGRRDELIAQTPAAQLELENTDVKAPVSGYVVGLSVFTDGGVAQAGAKLMEISPLDTQLVVSGELPVHLIDKVNSGLPVEMMFTAFNQNQTPHIPGIVTVVGKDRLVDEKTGVPYYKVFASTTPEGTAMLGELKIRAGMPVELFIKTGERSLMSYLLKPITDRVHSAMREH